MLVKCSRQHNQRLLTTILRTQIIMRKVTQRYLRDTGDEFENRWEDTSLEDAELVRFLEGRLKGPSRRVNPTS